MSWQTYTLSLVIFNIIGIVVLFILQLIQGMLPLNPQKFGAVRWDPALNTAISFGTNTKPRPGMIASGLLSQLGSP